VLRGGGESGSICSQAPQFVKAMGHRLNIKHLWLRLKEGGIHNLIPLGANDLTRLYSHIALL